MSSAVQCSPRPITTAATAPAPPATIKLAQLQRKSSRQTAHTGRPVDRPMAPATRPVLTKKYVAMAATSGCDKPEKLSGATGPPSHWYDKPAAAIVMASAAILNTVRYTG